MAAGQGFKTFITGEVLTAGDVNGYLMQGVLVFASAAARDAAITSPQEGQFAYLKDTNVTTYYTGSAWTNLDTTGMVNPMTTTGDTIYSSSGSTPARLGIGSTGNVLTVAGGVPTWAAPAGGGASWSLVNAGGTSLTGATTITVSGISSADKVMVLVEGASAGASSLMSIRFNADSGTNYPQMYVYNIGATSYNAGNFTSSNFFTGNYIEFGKMSANTASTVNGYVQLSGGNSSGSKAFSWAGGGSPGGSSGHYQYFGGGIWSNSATVSSVSILSDSGNFDAGKIYIYKSA